MLAEAEKAAALEIPPPGSDPRLQANVIRARLAGSDFAETLRPVLYPEDDDG